VSQGKESHPPRIRVGVVGSASHSVSEPAIFGLPEIATEVVEAILTLHPFTTFDLHLTFAPTVAAQRTNGNR